jgi:hypothetical protein
MHFPIDLTFAAGFMRTNGRLDGYLCPLMGDLS